ncbi:MAG TPA: glycosyltransferase [Candidatus Nanoarchaeia archaeon]|nr:glycosyltransferase [Candidatus Nanoarchaeia archaeon]
MKAAMVFPSRESEKAISGYSTTLTESMRKNEINIDNVTYIAGNPWSIFKKIGKLCKYDLIHIQHEYNLLGGYGIPFFFLYFILFLSRAKIITTMHTILSQKEKFKDGFLKIFLRKMLYRVQNRVINYASDKIIVHANFFKAILVKEYGVNPRKIEIFPQAIIEDVKTISKEKAKKKFKLTGNVYLFMGSIVPDHGHDIIIKQADKIGKTILVVANPAPINDRNKQRTTEYLTENQEYVKKNNLSKFVRFDIFDITDKNPLWWEYFSASDLVLLPYRGGIGSGIFAHAMAVKKPVIASNIKFFNEISNNFGCIKIAKNDKEYPKIIKEAIKPKNYKKMVKECERYLKEYGLTPLSKKYKKIYESLK